MKYKLLAVDLDGTLLNSRSVMSERTKLAVRAAMDGGVLFVPSSGRPLRGLGFLSRAFESDLPFITFNGGVVITSRTKKVIFAKNLTPEIACRVYGRGVESGAPVVMWEGDSLFASCDCRAVREYQAIVGADMHVLSSADQLEGRAFAKMIWLVPPEDGVWMQTQAREYFKDTVNCHISRPYLLEFVDVDVSKAKALEEVGAAYGIDRSEMIAVGDSYNDVSMLQYAGLGIAMENAPDEIKKICREVTLSNDADGVAAAIDKHILK